MSARTAALLCVLVTWTALFTSGIYIAIDKAKQHRQARDVSIAFSLGGPDLVLSGKTDR